MRRFLSFRLRTVLVLVTLVCCGLVAFLSYQKWHRVHSVAEQWVAQLFDETGQEPLDEFSMRFERPFVCPAKLSKSEQLEVLRHAILKLDKRRHRIAGLQLLIESYPAEAVEVISRTVAQQNDAYVAALMIRLLGLSRKRDQIDVIEPFLKDRHPRRRAAAAEAIGLIRKPSFPIPWDWRLKFDCVPALDFKKIMSKGDDAWRINDVLQPVRGNLRAKVKRLMATGSSPMEREAAARALVAWDPPDYRLRVAEWGVWLSDNGQLDLLQEVLADIPPFVHRTGNGVRQLATRIHVSIPTFTTKPIIHLTADQPLAVDLTVRLTLGRPWLAYPLPNDLVLSLESSPATTRVNRVNAISTASLLGFDFYAGGPLVNAFEGYPWLAERHRETTVRPDKLKFAVTDVGLRWQSLIVTPNKPGWSGKLPRTTEPRHAWWEQLREVPSSWITSRQETERFIYYDGPSRIRSPVQITAKAGGLDIVHRHMLTRDIVRLQSVESVTQTGPDVTRQAMYVEVDKRGALTARLMTIRENTSRIELAQQPRVDEGEATARLKLWLTEYGLTEAEADGLIVSWRQRFFRTPGRRVLMLLKPEEYDTMCPMIIRPLPTEVVRLGITLTEFATQ